MGRAADIHLAGLLGWVDFYRDETMGTWYAIPPENLASPQQPSGIPLKVWVPQWTTCSKVVEDLIERTIKAMIEFNPVLGRVPNSIFNLTRYGTGQWGARFGLHSDVPMSMGDTIAEAVSKASTVALEEIAVTKIKREVVA